MSRLYRRSRGVDAGRMEGLNLKKHPEQEDVQAVNERRVEDNL
jgi:hypothetical protein